MSKRPDCPDVLSCAGCENGRIYNIRRTSYVCCDCQLGRKLRVVTDRIDAELGIVNEVSGEAQKLVPRSAVQAALDAMPRCGLSECARPARLQYYDQEVRCGIHAGLEKAWHAVEWLPALEAIEKALGQ